MSDETQADPVVADLLSKVDSPWRIDKPDELQSAPKIYAPPDGEPGDLDEPYKKRLSRARRKIRDQQSVLYAGKQYSVLLVFQALDAAGKDGAIREVFQGLDPAAVRVASFKRPTAGELAHDFLWRTTHELPERGIITAFNRSYYEEVLAVRVHRKFLHGQYAGASPDPETLWPQRYRAIREHERHLATANTIILKFWLNVSPAQQAQRFKERIEVPSKNWKFSMGDIAESDLREQYDEAVLHMLKQTSRPWAPWFCLPADDRWYLRYQIADIVHQTLSKLPLQYPAAELPAGQQREELMQKLKDRISS